MDVARAYGVVLHPLENGTAGEHGTDDDAEPGFSEHDIRGTPGRVSGVGDGDPDVGLLQGWRVVHAIPSHPADVLPLLQFLDDLVLVLCIISTRQQRWDWLGNANIHRKLWGN